MGPSLITGILKRKVIILGSVLLAIVAMTTFLAPILSPYGPMDMAPTNRLKPPSLRHLFGTDKAGRDLFTRITYGGRISFLVGGAVVVFVMIVGIILGVVAGYFRYVDNVIMRTLDGMMAFPPILLAISMMASLGHGVENVIIALGLVYMPRVARIVRSQVLQIKERDYTEAARALGSPETRIMIKHIFPNCISPIIIQATFIFAYAVLAEAALSFLGAGVPPTIPTWGNIISEGRDVFTVAYWYMLFSGIFIVFTVFSINMIGDGLRDVFDPLTYMHTDASK